MYYCSSSYFETDSKTSKTFETNFYDLSVAQVQPQIKKIKSISRHNIHVVGHSADGDPRLLQAMKSLADFNFVPHIDVLENIKNQAFNSICVQDTIHIGTKLRNRLLNSSITLRFGDKIATPVHIKLLLDNVSKEVHGLVNTDIYTLDRQNFNSLQKIMSPRVLAALKSNIADSEGTVMFLELCEYITSSYLQKDMPTIDRLYKLWYAVYFIRCWRKWITMKPKMKYSTTLQHNFITSNAYSCIELNAHSLLKLIVKLREAKTPSMFQTTFFSSQQCEELFRRMRSMGTANYTKINFSVYDLIHMTSRVELMYEIISSRKEIITPRMALNIETSEAGNQELPSDELILNTIIKAKNDAIQKAAQFGINLATDDILSCDLKQETRDKTLDELVDEEDADIRTDSSEDSMSDTSSLDAELDAEINTRDMERSLENQNENEMASEMKVENDANSLFGGRPSGRHIEIVDDDGSSKSMRISTYLWSLTKSKHKLSLDRLKRVQDKGPEVAREVDTQQNKRAKLSEPNEIPIDFFLHKSEGLSINDWAIFRSDAETVAGTVDNSLDDSIHLGIVVGFRFIEKILNAKTKKMKMKRTRCNAEYVSTNQTESLTKNKKIQVLCIWYTWSENGILQPRKNSDNLIVILSNYLISMKTPDIKKNSNRASYFLDTKQLNELKSFMQEH